MNTILSPDLIFFLLVAVFLNVRLRSVLGRRTGNEKKPKDIFTYQDSILEPDKKKVLEVKEAIKRKTPLSLPEKKINNLKKSTGLERIFYFDKNFSPKKFLEGAKIAFKSIIETYAKDEISKIKNLLSSNVFSAFSREIKSRVQKKHSLEHTLISLKSADIEKIHVKSSIADIVVKFVSEQVNLLKNEKGKTLSGNDEYIENHIDYWTFSKDLKSTNPNWKLFVTKTKQ